MGWETAQLLAKAGAHVVLSDVKPAELQDKVAELTGSGLKAAASAFDVADQLQVRAAVDAIVSVFGSIDIVVNNAGNQNRKPFIAC